MVYTELAFHAMAETVVKKNVEECVSCTLFSDEESRHVLLIHAVLILVDDETIDDKTRHEYNNNFTSHVYGFKLSEK